MGAQPQSQKQDARGRPTVTAPVASPKKPAGFVRLYLFLYNLVSLLRWSYILLKAVQGLALALDLAQTQHKDQGLGAGALASMYDWVFLTLLSTQTLAVLEVVHSCLKLVRAGLVTTAMQVASRLVVVWAVLYAFGRGGPLLRAGEVGVVGVGGDPAGQVLQLGDAAFTAAVLAWSLTECVRYAFFSISLLGLEAPGFLVWLRYSTFYVLYPVGITGECLLVFLSIRPALAVSKLLASGFVALLFVYVPGSYMLYTHMISQRRKVMAPKSHVS